MSREKLKAELDYINKNNDPMQQRMTDNVLEVYDVLMRQGHSGYSFDYVTKLIYNLIFENNVARPILAYEDDPDDWIDYGKVYQNKRKSSVFYYKDTKTYGDVSRSIATSDDGETWFSTGGWFKTFDRIKVPYLPDGKKWHIYIEPTIDLEPGYGADDGEYIIKKVEYR